MQIGELPFECAVEIIAFNILKNAIIQSSQCWRDNQVIEEYKMENIADGTDKTGDKTLGILVHIGGIFFSWLAPLVLFLVKKDSGDKFTIDNSREALNFQITVLIMYIGCFILSFVLIGIFLFWVVMLGNLILSIMAAVKASDGLVYHYPMTIRLIK